MKTVVLALLCTAGCADTGHVLWTEHADCADIDCLPRPARPPTDTAETRLGPDGTPVVFLIGDTVLWNSDDRFLHSGTNVGNEDAFGGFQYSMTMLEEGDTSVCGAGRMIGGSGFSGVFMPPGTEVTIGGNYVNGYRPGRYLYSSCAEIEGDINHANDCMEKTVQIVCP